MLSVQRAAALPASGYARLPNEWARDARLHWADRGLLLWLWSHRPGYQFTEQDLVEASPAGRDAVRAIVRRLARFGYVAKRWLYRGLQRVGAVWSLTAPSDAPAAPCDAARPDGQPVVNADLPEQAVSAGEPYDGFPVVSSMPFPEEHLEEQVLTDAAAPVLTVVDGGNPMAEQQPTLFDVQAPAALEVLTGELVPAPAPANGGSIAAGFVDYCRERGVTLTSRLIARYGKSAKQLLHDGIDEMVIKRAMAQMLADHVVQFPARLEQYVMEQQQGEEVRRAPMVETFRQRQDRERQAQADEWERAGYNPFDAQATA